MPIDPAFLGNRYISIIYKFPCPQRILMVTDGLDFSTDGFGLSEFVGIIRAAGHTVHTAHRFGSGPNLTIPGNYDFSTAATPLTTANYDQLWLFGVDSNPTLSAPQQSAIAQFMQAGGGVFATGDHSTLGLTLGANIPRVRSMREWATVPMSSTDRLDTVLDPGGDGIQQFDDQSDAIAQRMFPVFFSNGGAQTSASTWSVHPVLRHPSGAVDVLPDHPHESECYAPAPFAGNFAGVEEWPAPLVGGSRIAPVLVAKSISAGRFLTDALKPPVMPRCFGAISAYDGDPAQVGRIVCDATWHHFININLNGQDAAADANGTPRIGLYSAPGVPTAEYLKIQTYFRNTARWLAPRGRRFCWPFLVAAVARFDIEAIELQLPRPHPCPWDPLIDIGRSLESVIDKRFGPGALAAAVDDMLDALGEGSGLASVLHSRAAVEARDKQDGLETLLPLADMRRAAFASLVNLLAERLPADERKLEEIMKRHDGLALEAIGESLLAAERAIAVHLERALSDTFARTELLKKQPLKSSLAAARDRTLQLAKAQASNIKPRPTKPRKPTTKPKKK